MEEFSVFKKGIIFLVTSVMLFFLSGGIAFCATDLSFPVVVEVNKSFINLRACPSTSCDKAGYARKGDRLEAVSKEKSWYKVVMPDKKFAWVYEALVEIVVEKVEAPIREGEGKLSKKPDRADEIKNCILDRMRILVDQFNRTKSLNSSFKEVGWYPQTSVPPDDSAVKIGLDDKDSLVVDVWLRSWDVDIYTDLFLNRESYLYIKGTNARFFCMLLTKLAECEKNVGTIKLHISLLRRGNDSSLQWQEMGYVVYEPHDLEHVCSLSPERFFKELGKDTLPDSIWSR